MFKSLIKRLFPSIQSKKDNNYFYFEQNSKIAKEESATTPPAQPILQQPLPISSIEQLSAEQCHQISFYDYLFGESPPTKTHDELSSYVSDKIEKLMTNPKYILASLPVLTASLSKVLSELNNEDFEVSELIGLIEQEPVIAAKVLELSNSSFYNHSDKEVTDLKSAFMLLGRNGLVEGVINGFVCKLTPQSKIYFKQYGNKIWQHCQETGIIAKSLINDSNNKKEAAQGYLIALICNLGDMITFQLLMEAFSFVHPDCQPNSYAFKSLMQKNSKKLTYFIAKHWQFPEPILHALALQLKITHQRMLTSLSVKYPVACYVYEANIISELVLIYGAKEMDESQLMQAKQDLIFSKEANNYLESFMRENR